MRTSTPNSSAYGSSHRRNAPPSPSKRISNPKVCPLWLRPPRSRPPLRGPRPRTPSPLPRAPVPFARAGGSSSGPPPPLGRPATLCSCRSGSPAPRAGERSPSRRGRALTSRRPGPPYAGSLLHVRNAAWVVPKSPSAGGAFVAVDLHPFRLLVVLNGLGDGAAVAVQDGLRAVAASSGPSEGKAIDFGEE